MKEYNIFHVISIKFVGMIFLFNAKNCRERRNGLYYETSWRTALATTARFISITSFNEWHEVGLYLKSLILLYFLGQNEDMLAIYFHINTTVACQLAYRIRDAYEKH